MELNISTYYYQNVEKESDDMVIVKEIEKYIELIPESGYRPVTVHLNKNMLVNHKKVNRIMREYHLLCRKKKKYQSKTTDSKHDLKKYKNIAKNFKTTDINQLIVGDVTAYDIKGKDHFLANLMDIHNREVVGKAISDKNNTELVLAALENAVQNRGRENLKGCLHHTDSDVRYCSGAYIQRLKSLEIEISMCVGNAYENAHAESFNSTVKRQEINISYYDSKEESACSIFSFIDKYNTIRPHSSIQNLAPVEFKNLLLKAKQCIK
jgi:putative transposase